MNVHRSHLLIPTILALASAALAPAARADVLVNGGFEEPATGGYTTIAAGDPALTGWTVVSGSVDVVRNTDFPAYESLQSLDLDGSAAGTIEQSFATSIGSLYTLTFAYANNPYGGTNPAFAAVSLSGLGASDLLDQSFTHGGSTTSAMNYQTASYDFVANSAVTTLRFASLDDQSSSGGIVLDAVSVTARTSAVPEPSVLALAGVGAAGVAARAVRRRKA